jgi:hypothetical protein
VQHHHGGRLSSRAVVPVRGHSIVAERAASVALDAINTAAIHSVRYGTNIHPIGQGRFGIRVRRRGAAATARERKRAGDGRHVEGHGVRRAVDGSAGHPAGDLRDRYPWVAVPHRPILHVLLGSSPPDYAARIGELHRGPSHVRQPDARVLCSVRGVRGKSVSRGTAEVSG